MEREIAAYYGKRHEKIEADSWELWNESEVVGEMKAASRLSLLKPEARERVQRAIEDGEADCWRAAT